MNQRPLPSPDPEQRKLWCAHAGQCLTLAHRAGWPGFSCGSCGDYRQQDVDPLWEAHASARLLAAMIGLPWLPKEKREGRWV